MVKFNWPHISTFTTLEDTDEQRQALEAIVAQIPEDDPMRARAEMYTKVIEGNPDVEQKDKETFLCTLVERVLGPDTEEYVGFEMDEEELESRRGQLMAQQRLQRS